MTKTREEVTYCPRRLDYIPQGAWPEDVEKSDFWRTNGGFAGSEQIPDGKFCSYCGSLHPGVLLDLLKQGWVIEGSDKGYKWYVGRPMTQEEKDRRKAQIEEVKRYTGKDHSPMEHHLESVTVGKFYTVHFNRKQAEEFLQLWKDDKLVHSMYVNPWLPAMSETAPEWLKGN